MRTLLLIAALALPAAAAQTALQIVDPVLSVGGRALATDGAPLALAPFDILTIVVPSDGTYEVSDRPFAGARRVGEFDGPGLVFAAAGRSVRLRSRAPILDRNGPIAAYVRYSPDSDGGRGPAQLFATPFVGDDRARDRRPQTAAALRADLDRVGRDRDRLAASRDRIARARRRALRPAPVDPFPTVRRVAVAGADARLATLRADRDRLDGERQRLDRERRALADALREAQAERDRIERDLRRLRQQPLARGAEGEAARLRAEIDALRDAVRDRDRAVAQLRADDADRAARLPQVDAELQRVRRDLADARAERDRALSARAAAEAERDAAVLRADVLEIEADRLRGELAQAEPSTDLDAERAAIARDRALLARDRAALDDERRALRENAPDRADRRDLLRQLEAAQTDREALVAERDRLARELAGLRRSTRAARPPAPDPTPPAARPVPPPAPAAPSVATPRPPRGAVSLPDLDLARLQNAPDVTRLLTEAEYPRFAARTGISGDVVVLFQTDRTGRVVRTAVARPLGGGLDEWAESLVREMRFEAPTVDGQPTGLRSQVTVRFAPVAVSQAR